MKKPSPTQLETLREMSKYYADGRIHREDGGFWTINGMTRNIRGNPDWFVQIQTIRSMEKFGWIKRRNVHAEEWKDERELTENGWAVLKQFSSPS